MAGTFIQKENIIKIGDVVTFKSGSDDMTVSEISGDGNYIDVIYQATDGTVVSLKAIHKDVFDIEEGE